MENWPDFAARPSVNAVKACFEDALDMEVPLKEPNIGCRTEQNDYIKIVAKNGMPPCSRLN
jgi:hypothetical protein